MSASNQPTSPANQAKSLPIAQVVVERALDKEFDYKVPNHLRHKVVMGCQVHVPFGKSQVKGFIVGFTNKSAWPQLKEIRSLVLDKPLVQPNIMELAVWMAEYYVSPLSQVLKTILPGAVRKDGLQFREQLIATPLMKKKEVEKRPELKLTEKQELTFDILLEQGTQPVSSLAQAAGVTTSVIHKLREKGLISVETGTLRRDPHEQDTILPSAPLTCTDEQKEALKLIRNSINTGEPRVTLLYGVTGSGKTEVYLQSISHALNQGKTAIVLVPEISLTPQTVERFRARFGKGIAVLHSHLSAGERHDEWHRIHEGGIPIVIGARSALFAPVPNLGLIVVDEEHETSYKQSESPHYNARDVAVMRGHMEGCSVILGSATPSVESFNNVEAGKYAMAKLTHRVQDAKLPSVRIVDMRMEMEREGKPVIFSRELMDGITNRLQKQEQIILFLNRRGYATQLLCAKCGYVAECPHCSLTLTFHRRLNQLRCHMCGEQQIPPDICPVPDCRDPQFKYTGLGTEKVEVYLSSWFKHATIRRVDSDSMRSKDAFRNTLNDFKTGRIDILIGTQMIAKGLHFPNVTLVGVINADSTLHMPEFRAAERTFQLITQVAGRAGRGDLHGQVVVQTYSPQEAAIEAAQALDYDRFYKDEIKFRQEAHFPPFTHMVRLLVRGPKEEQVIECFNAFKRVWDAQQVSPAVIVGGPTPCTIIKIKDLYRYQMTFRAPTTRMITRPLRQAMASHKWPSKLKYTIDVDSSGMM